MNFGTVVEFDAVLRPMYLSMQVPQRRVPVPGNNFFTKTEDVPGADPELVSSSVHHRTCYPEELGGPLHDELEVPKGGVHRRLRRFKQVSPVRGIIVGKTWRSEGRYQDGDYEQTAYLIEHRRVTVYEVAVRRGSGALFASEILLVHPDDTRSIDVVHQQAAAG